MRIIVYLSGPMTGLSDFNYPAFIEAARRLREQGFEVINPAEAFGGRTDLPRQLYMRNDVAALFRAQAIVHLPGWETSKGARLEHDVAEAFGLPAWDFDKVVK